MAIKNNILRKVFFAGCLLMIVVSLGLIWKSFERRTITERGKTIIANIVEAPADCSELTTRGGYCKLKYNGKVFGKKAGIKFCSLVSKNTTVSMLTNEDEDVFLFVDEYDPIEFLYSIAIIIIAIIIGIKGLRR